MSDNFIDGLRALAAKHPRTVRSAARMRQPLDGADAQALEGALTLAERDRDEARAEVERLREALREWDALIRHQYSGTRDAMSDMQHAALNTKRLLDPLEAKP